MPESESIVSDKKLYKVQSDWLEATISLLHNDSVVVLAPKELEEGITRFTEVESAQEVAKDYINTVVSLKEVLFPCSETLVGYENTPDGDVKLNKAPVSHPETVVIGCRPCDAAAVEVLDKVFTWDYDDTQYRSRRESTTIVAFACSKAGPECFCSSLGGSPHDRRGSDVLVFSCDNGDVLFEVLSDKGEKLLEKLGNNLKTETVDCPLPDPPEFDLKFDTDKIKRWLDKNFESEFWTDVALRCLGCGACSYLCPTCHCFDIVDEGDWKSGERKRNWDCCSFSLFTKHASGHNPRPTQTTRCRQRVMHKFKYFPDRFEKISCVGCGRCILNCGVGQNLVSILTQIENMEE